MELLTCGVSHSLQLKESFLCDVIIAAYQSGTIPNHYKPKLPSFLEELMSLDFYISCPSIQLLPSSLNNVKICLQAKVQTLLVPIAVVDCQVKIKTCIKVNEKDQDGKRVSFLAFDFSDEDSVELEFNPVFPTQFSLAGLDTVLESLLAAALQNIVEDIPLTPFIESQDLSLAINARTNLPIQAGSNYKPENFLSIFVEQGRACDPYGTHQAQLNNFDCGNCSVGMLKGTIISYMEKGFEAEGIRVGQPLPGVEKKVLIKHPFLPIRLEKIILKEEFSVEFYDGYIRLMTKVEAVLSNCPDADVTVDIQANFGFSGGNVLKINIIKSNIDVKVNLLGVASILAGLLGGLLNGIIALVVGKAIEKAAASIVAGVLAQGFQTNPLIYTLFLKDITITTDPKEPPAKIATLVVSGVDSVITAEGIFVRTRIGLNYKSVKLEKPELIRGNKTSSEFHRPGCPLGDKIKKQNLVEFYLVAEAQDKGYNGCSFCYPEYDYLAPSFLNVLVIQDRLPTEMYNDTAKITCALISSTPGFEKYGSPDTRQAEVQFSKIDTPNSPNQALGHAAFDNMRPGQWEIRVEMGTWSTKKTVTTVGDRMRSYIFTYGKTGAKRD